MNIASLLRQPAPRSRLEQGQHEQIPPLAPPSGRGAGGQSPNALLLGKYLKQVVVKVSHLDQFRPSKTKIDRNDIETIIGDFRRFLETALDDRDGTQSTIGEIR